MSHALEEYEVVSDALVITNQIVATLTVDAPIGKSVIGGGFHLSDEPNGNPSPFFASASQPVSNNAGWRVDVTSKGNDQRSVTLTVWAICAKVAC